MRADHRNLLGHVPEDRRHQLRVFLVAGIVAELAESLIVDRLPYEPVEQTALLRDPRSQRVQVVLRADHLGTRRLPIGVQIHPVGRVSHRVRRGSHRHGDPVMSEAHPDIPDDDPLLPVERLPVFPDPDILHAEDRTDRRVLLQTDRIVLFAVIAELPDELLFGPDGLAVFRAAHRIAEDRFGMLFHGFTFLFNTTKVSCSLPAA